jgi:tetratricopeptide (TPR) repeat protein
MTFPSIAATNPAEFAKSILFRISCGIVAAILLSGNPLMAAQDAGPVGEEDLTEASGAETSPEAEKAAEEEVKQKIAQRRQFYFDALMKELDSMVPGEFEEGSKQKTELERAVNAFLDRDIQTLNDILDQQAAFDPDFPPRHLMLASMSYRVRDPKQGRQLLEKAAVASPKYPGTYAAFARLALNEGRITDAMALLDKCARMVREGKVNDKVKDHFGRQYVAGMLQVAIAQGRYQDARDLLDRQMKQFPDNPKSYLTGAEIEFKAGDLAQSQSYLEKLKELVPEARPFESVFAKWFRQKGNLEEAGKWVVAAAEKYPKDVTSQLDNANWLMGKGDFVGVQAAIAKVEGISGESTSTRFLKGQLAFADDRMEEAEKLFEKVIEETKGRNLEAVNLYALAMSESSDPEKQKNAQKIAQQTLGRAPRSTVAQASLAYILLRQDITKQSQRLLLPVVRSKRVSSEVAYFFGYMLYKLGKNDSARQALQSALENKDLFLYRKKCQQLLDQLGGPVSGDLPTPAVSETPATP